MVQTPTELDGNCCRAAGCGDCSKRLASRLAYPVICIAVAADGHVASNEDAWHVGCQNVRVRDEEGIDQPGHTVGPHWDIRQRVETLRQQCSKVVRQAR
jgi:6-phosphogluconolactonase/glucosamine-6-phosphate isomerase/deaminase